MKNKIVMGDVTIEWDRCNGPMYLDDWEDPKPNNAAVQIMIGWGEFFSSREGIDLIAKVIRDQRDRMEERILDRVQKKLENDTEEEKKLFWKVRDRLEEEENEPLGTA